MTNERGKLIFDLYKENFNVKEIADKFGMKRKQIYNIVTKYQIKELNSTEKPKKRFAIPQVIYDELENFLSHPKTCRSTLQICREHLCHIFHLMRIYLFKLSVI